MPLNFCLQNIFTKMGWVVAAWGEAGLVALELPCITLEEALGKIGLRIDKLKRHQKNSPLYTNSHDPKINLSHHVLKEALISYFNGEKVNTVTIPVDFSFYSSFARQVLPLVQQIPYGKTYSYQQIACLAKQPKAARAVGRALQANHTPLVIPCHRVIHHHGDLGGFSRGSNWKHKLLTLEGIRITSSSILI
ncbi:MAG TPA: cysteine methyltransferase [Desulfotomaculum sp.]|jgi:methylated-DNA-[protein]-cysteine S-methyltransferase|nr:cysteine methyltransferase [Desulfotomaculum sp.]